jgi:thiamine-monophosphate kinase
LVCDGLERGSRFQLGANPMASCVGVGLDQRDVGCFQAFPHRKIVALGAQKSPGVATADLHHRKQHELKDTHAHSSHLAQRPFITTTASDPPPANIGYGTRVTEFELIERFVGCFTVAPPPAGPGDDCAVLPAQRSSCVTTDAIFEGVHFTLDGFSYEDIGYKALAVNLSDLAAMGAQASWFTVALGLPNTVQAAELMKMGRGMAELAMLHGMQLVGGNVSRAKQLSVTITASGLLDGQPLLRSGARVGDRLFVSGTLGDAAGGLRAIAQHKRQPALLRAQRRPAPHLAFAAAARRLASAAIDVSDGLAQDLQHLCRASKVGASLLSAKLPISEDLAKFAPDDALDLALRGGEDYVLLLAVPERNAEAMVALGGFEIGSIIESGLTLDGVPLTGPLGFQHRT